jgi:hypothetical protein
MLNGKVSWEDFLSRTVIFMMALSGVEDQRHTATIARAQIDRDAEPAANEARQRNAASSTCCAKISREPATLVSGAAAS